MAGAIVSCAKAANCDTVVDAGSGKGYLSSLLALECGLRVVAVEGRAANSAAAKKRLSRIVKGQVRRPPLVR
eukprot:SAG31_NODE_479_length_15133_cov_39.816283_7_plen_72_part_00